MKKDRKKDIERKNNIVRTAFLIYILLGLYIFFASAEHGLVTHSGAEFYNAFYWIRLIIVGIVSAVFWGLYVYFINKWDISFRCPYCNRMMDPNKIVPNPAEGFMGTQTCPNCKREFTPKIEDE